MLVQVYVLASLCHNLAATQLLSASTANSHQLPCAFGDSRKYNLGPVYHISDTLSTAVQIEHLNERPDPSPAERSQSRPTKRNNVSHLLSVPVDSEGTFDTDQVISLSIRDL